MKTIFDFGMYDASDTRYYLECGFRVVAVEANPVLIKTAQTVLAHYVAAGQLQLVGAAISNDDSEVELTVCGEDAGSSSIYGTRVDGRSPLGTFTVPGITTGQLFQQFGIPYYLKIDLEGADRLPVLSLKAETRPEYLSFELGDEGEELIDHAAAIGFTRFKIINQCSFREVARQQNLRDRIARKIIRMLGYAEPQYVKRGGRLFKIAHSSGPAPWCSDGRWSSRAEILNKWKASRASSKGNIWYDLHAN
jgi:FkbM family methyltransferase